MLIEAVWILSGSVSEVETGKLNDLITEYADVVTLDSSELGTTDTLGDT